MRIVMRDNHFTQTILHWYAANGRDLPWRRTKDPYAIWLSEIILQQTRIAQGQAYWEQFVEKWPTVQDLAKASEDEVLRCWQGLGYYSRARNLHAAARQIVALGAFPQTYDGIRALKGVGDYTAAAIGSIAFGLPKAVVDGNVYRVLARHYGISTVVGSTTGKKEFTAIAQDLLPEEDPGTFNQAMMDFGALQCTPINPACLTCPLTGTCDAFRTGRTEVLPVRKAPTAVRERRCIWIYLRCKGRTAIRRREGNDIWKGLWEPLSINDKQDLPKASVPLKSDVRHQLTHRTILADFYYWETEKEPDLPEGYIWINETELDRYGKPRLFEILLQEL